MFTGAVPFTGETFLGVLSKHLHDPPPAMNTVFPELAISYELHGVIMRALEKNPEARYQNMSEFSQAILSTPEGSGIGRPSLISSPMMDLSGYAQMTPGSPTAAQFQQKPQTLGPAVQAGSPSAVQTGPHSAQTTGGADINASVVATHPAETQAATAATIVPSRSGVGLALALVGTLVVLGGGVVAAVLLKRGNADPQPGARTETTALASTAVAVNGPAPIAPSPHSAETVPTAPPAPSASAVVSPASGVRLDVITDPAGATLTKNGFQVCDQTPCEVVAASNETLELEARKGTLRGTAKVLAQRDQRVSIKLVGATAKAPTGPRMCEVEVDGLKILRPCK
jgi:serine/threonine-protein kinase